MGIASAILQWRVCIAVYGTTDCFINQEKIMNELYSPIEHRELINRAIKQRDEITQIFSDVDHWNRTRTQFEYIDADPDGDLKEMAAGLDSVLNM